MNFLDVKTDFAFKKVFGSEGSKDILLSFLNALIEFPHQQKIKDLTIVDPYSIPLLRGMKDTYVDVKAVLDNDTRVIIEMQVLNHEGLEKRILYNAAKNYSVQLKKGDAYELLNPVIALTITDFLLLKNNESLITNFKLIEKNKFIEYGDDIELIFIELPRFIKTLEECQSLQDKWLYFIKNAGSLAYVPENIEGDIQKAFAIANEANLNEEELELQHRKKDWIYIQKGSIKLAKKQGLEQGLQQGLEQGSKAEKIKIAKNLIGLLDNQTIAEKTGLSEQEIKDIGSF